MTAKFRMYIDEVGNPDLGSSEDPNHRYLSLCGVIMDLEHVDKVFFPRLDAMKKAFFGSHPDEQVVLHRKELMDRREPFEALRNPETERRFNTDLLALFHEVQYSVVAVVIDKLAHREQYRTWRADPYHYCLEVLVERFVLWLDRQGARGDVMAESRGGKEDRRLKDSFNRVYREGSDFVPAPKFAERLTSCQLKVRNKQIGIAGLQLADLLAYPAYKSALLRHQGKPLPEDFTGKVATILEKDKFVRSPSGVIEGWGRKWLP
jgi:hypothetical protein